MVKSSLLIGSIALFAFAGCVDESIDPAGSAAEGGSAPTGGSEAAGAGTPETGGSDTGGAPPAAQAATITGNATWSVTFDEAALAAGATNCSYTRHYEAIEDGSAKWLCPACEVMFYGDVELSDGLATCFDQISPGVSPLENEWLGYGDGVWYRGSGGPMSAQGTPVFDDNAVTLTHSVAALEAPAGGFFDFAISGTFTLGTTEADPMNGFNVPDTYACGWPKANPAPYTGDYTVEIGGTLPDGLFKDKCEETVRLHDFAGAYLLVDMAAIDCPPCQTMAGEEEAFIADMAAQGITVHVITLLAPSLSDVLGHTSTTQLENWTEEFELTSPILADRGWGLSQFLPVFGEEVGYPSWVLVNPDLEIIDMNTGFGGFADFQTAIEADAGG